MTSWLREVARARHGLTEMPLGKRATGAGLQIAFEAKRLFFGRELN